MTGLGELFVKIGIASGKNTNNCPKPVIPSYNPSCFLSNKINAPDGL